MSLFRTPYIRNFSFPRRFYNRGELRRAYSRWSPAAWYNSVHGQSTMYVFAQRQLRKTIRDILSLDDVHIFRVSVSCVYVFVSTAHSPTNETMSVRTRWRKSTPTHANANPHTHTHSHALARNWGERLRDMRIRRGRIRYTWSGFRIFWIYDCGPLETRVWRAHNKRAPLYSVCARVYNIQHECFYMYTCITLWCVQSIAKMVALDWKCYSNFWNNNVCNVEWDSYTRRICMCVVPLQIYVCLGLVCRSRIANAVQFSTTFSHTHRDREAIACD